MRRGQAVAEFAMILPLQMLIFLGFMETMRLYTQKAEQDRATAVVAEYAASHAGESWHQIHHAGVLADCSVSVSRPIKDLVEATSRCLFQPIGPWRDWVDLPIVSTEAAAVPMNPTPSLTPSPT